MKILLTGADVEEHDGEFDVVYQQRVVFHNRSKGPCLAVAMDRDELENLLYRCYPELNFQVINQKYQ